MKHSHIVEAYAAGNFELVLEHFNSYSEPLTFDLWGIKGESLQRLRRYEDAMQVWNLAIANLGDHAAFYSERGVCKFHLRYKSALEDLNRAVELEPDNPYRYACRAYVKDKIGDTEGAIEDYRKAHEMEPDNEITLNNLGLAEEKLGHTKKAREHFKKADELAGVDHITDKYFNQEDREPALKAPEKSSLSKEMRKMISSREEFKRFWSEALKMLRIRK